MIRWHKPGQKVTMVEPHVWPTGSHGAQAAFGIVYTINNCVLSPQGNLHFNLAELHRLDNWGARWFRPVYPKLIEELATMEVPVLEPAA
jgi:hypothetical protein